MDFEALFGQLNKRIDAAKKDGGLVFGMNGITLREYFAAHAPPMPPGYLDPAHSKMTELSAIVRWRWAYAAEMLEKRPKNP